MRQTLVVVTGLVTLAACARHSSEPTSRPEPPRASLAARPPDSACARILATHDSLAALPPQPDSVIVPPMPVPSSMRNNRYTASVLVLTTGRIAPDSTVFSPAMDPGYEQHLRERMRRLHFIPSTIEGCPVARRYLLHYTF